MTDENMSYSLGRKEVEVGLEPQDHDKAIKYYMTPSAWPLEMY